MQDESFQKFKHCSFWLNQIENYFATLQIMYFYFFCYGYKFSWLFKTAWN